MSLTIFKATIDAEHFEFEAPEGAEILTAREQFDHICIWFRCDPTRPKETRLVEVCATGAAAPSGRYLGSAHLFGGQGVFHVFEPNSATGPASLKSVHEWTAERRAIIDREQNPRTGIACPRCGGEMVRSEGGELLSIPPQMDVHCPSCGHHQLVLK